MRRGFPLEAFRRRVFAIDPSIRGFPVGPDAILAAYQSLNSPHVAIPGKQAGPAQAFILGLKTSTGFGAFVYLLLAEVGDCAVYIPSRRGVASAREYQLLENQAMAFVESMGFMMDNLNFRQLTKEKQVELVRSLPPFQKEPPKPQVKSEPEKEVDSASLGRFFASF